jgi:hypothetical protein
LINMALEAVVLSGKEKMAWQYALAALSGSDSSGVMLMVKDHSPGAGVHSAMGRVISSVGALLPVERFN